MVTQLRHPAYCNSAFQLFGAQKLADSGSMTMKQCACQRLMRVVQCLLQATYAPGSPSGRCMDGMCEVLRCIATLLRWSATVGPPLPAACIARLTSAALRSLHVTA